MAKKHKHPEHENLERWLVSYADFMTLLFATFTALYALSLSDVNRLKDVAAAISQGFEEQSIIHGIQSVLQGKSPPARNPDPIASTKGAGSGVLGKYESMTYRPGEIKSTQEFVKGISQDAEAINNAINSLNHANALSLGKTAGMEDANAPIRPVEVAVQERGIRVSFDSRMLFAPGSAVIQQAGKKALDIVAERLRKMDGNVIHVEGHTDNAPIATAMYPSNWELSAGRAGSIVRYFNGRHQIDSHRLVAVGYADTQPLTSNSTPEGRAKNRRVDIVLYNQKAGALINPRLQFLKEHPVAIQTDRPDARKTPEAVLPTGSRSGPVRVIIKDKDGTERILIPKTSASEPITLSSPGKHPEKSTSAGKPEPLHSTEKVGENKPVPSTHPESHH